MKILAAFLLAAVIGPATPDPTAVRPQNPASYAAEIRAGAGDLVILQNGIEAARLAGGQAGDLLLTAFLKPGANKLAFTGAGAAGASVTLRRFHAGAGPDEVETLSETRLTTDGEILRFEAKDAPRLAFWEAEPADLDDAAKADILADLTRRHQRVGALLDARDAEGLAAFIVALSGNRDAALFLPKGAAEGQEDMLIEQLAPPVNDPARFALARAPLPGPDDLAFSVQGNHVVVTRKDGSAVLGFMYVTPRDEHASVTIDRPVYGRVNGVWTLLQDVRL